MTRCHIGVLALCLALGATALADTFRLKPGHEYKGQSVLEGKKLGQSGTKWIIKLDSGGVVTIEGADFADVGDEGGSGGGNIADELGLPALTFEPLIPDDALKGAIAEAKAAIPACPDMVVLSDGRKIVGTATPTDSGVAVNVNGERTDFQAGEFTDILPSPARAFQEHLQAAEGATVGTWLDLALWCLSEPLLDEGRKKAVMCLQVAVSLDPENAEAREQLGYERVEGVWLRGEELALAKGHRMENGKWVAKEAAELAVVRQQVLQWGDLGTMSYREAIRRVEDNVDTCQVQIGKGEGPFRPWRDECALRTSSEERSWAAAKDKSRLAMVMAYAKRYASADARTRRDERTKVLELEGRDMSDIWNCAECGGNPNYKAQEKCPTCGGESAGGGAGTASCQKCGGSGSRRCTKCGGDGKVDCRECANGVKGGGSGFYD